MPFPLQRNNPVTEGTNVLMPLLDALASAETALYDAQPNADALDDLRLQLFAHKRKVAAITIDLRLSESHWMQGFATKQDFGDLTYLWKNGEFFAKLDFIHDETTPADAFELLCAFLREVELPQLNVGDTEIALGEYSWSKDAFEGDPRMAVGSLLLALQRALTLKALPPPTPTQLEQGFFVENGYPCLRYQDRAILWEWIGEGESGDYDDSDPNDTPLLRFTVGRYIPTTDTHGVPLSPGDSRGEEFEAFRDCSYCTQMPRDTTPAVLREALLVMWGVLSSELLANNPQPHKLCERLSWISPSRLDKSVF